jgi:cobalt/nickel transport protein
VTPWAGVDETVVARVAAEAGRAPSRNESGDLLLFAFLCAGIVGGFVLGYFYRVLFVEGRRAR